MMELLLFLGAAALLLGQPGLSLALQAVTGSLSYFYMAVSEPNEGLPWFILVGHMNDQPFVQYNSDAGKMLPRAPWMKKAEKEDPQYWDRSTQIAQDTEKVYREGLGNVMTYYSQHGGFHTWQGIYSCELRSEGSKRGYIQYGYDGRDFISFNKETLAWTAANTQAQITKRKWEADLAIAQREKTYLEETCIEWLQRYLDYGKEALLRTEPPVVKVMRNASRDDLETLICEAHGFYPMKIDATWRRDGENLDYETFCGTVAPNSDGTYHILLSVEIDPKERERYRCHVDHAGLPEPLVLAWEEPGANVGHTVGAILEAVRVSLLVAGIISFLFIITMIIIKKREVCRALLAAEDVNSEISAEEGNLSEAEEPQPASQEEEKPVAVLKYATVVRRRLNPDDEGNLSEAEEPQPASQEEEKPVAVLKYATVVRRRLNPDDEGNLSEAEEPQPASQEEEKPVAVLKYVMAVQKRLNLDYEAREERRKDT